MIFYSLDIETTGLNPETDQILEIAILEVDSIDFSILRTLHMYVRHDRIEGSPYAIKMNSDIINKIYNNSDEENTYYSENVGSKILQFLKYNKVTFAGKNVSTFDIPFLKKYCPRLEYHHRSIDPTILFFDPQVDVTLPDLSKCKVRAGLSPNVSHTAIDDAKDIVDLLKFYYGNTSNS